MKRRERTGRTLRQRENETEIDSFEADNALDYSVVEAIDNDDEKKVREDLTGWNHWMFTN